MKRKFARTRAASWLLSVVTTLSIVIAAAYSMMLFASGAERDLPEENTGENASIEIVAGRKAEELVVRWDDTEDEDPVVEDVPWTEEEVDILAKLIVAEAGGTHDEVQQSAVVWCVLNRLDSGRFGDSIEEVVTAPHQFATIEFYPAMESYKTLAEDVLNRWWAEKQGAKDIGRTLPAEYLYFEGDGERNYFHAEWRDDESWDWSLPNPYAEQER